MAAGHGVFRQRVRAAQRDVFRRRRAIEVDLTPNGHPTTLLPHAQATPDLCLSKLNLHLDSLAAFPPHVIACELAYSQHSFPSCLPVRERYVELDTARPPVLLVPCHGDCQTFPSAVTTSRLAYREWCTTTVCLRAIFNAAVIDHDGTDVNLGPPTNIGKSELPQDKLCHAERNLALDD